MAERQLPKLHTGVRFPSPAPAFAPDLKDVYDILRHWRKCRPGSDFALATLARVEGSSYRRPGARMLIGEDGATVGSLSGGCLEDEVARRAQEVLRTGEPTIMSFDTRERFGCAGKIDILIERAPPEFFSGLAGHLEARRSCIAVTTSQGSFVGEAVSFQTENEIPRKNREADSFPYRPFLQEIHPPIRLLIFGVGPDNASLHSLGHILDWKVTEIIDPNTSSTEADRWTAAVVKSHNYGRDFAALQKLLPLNLRYVGLIGPRKRRDQLMHDLLDLGVTINAGFFAPAGLDLGAETPEEIALAIVTEIQRVFASGSGESLRERKMSIHAPESSASNQCRTTAR
jgi:xanthine dehydrogenase accessory factor